MFASGSLGFSCSFSIQLASTWRLFDTEIGMGAQAMKKWNGLIQVEAGLDRHRLDMVPLWVMAHLPLPGAPANDDIIRHMYPIAPWGSPLDGETVKRKEIASLQVWSDIYNLSWYQFWKSKVINQNQIKCVCELVCVREMTHLNWGH